MIVLIASVSIGVKASFGAFDGGYEVQGSFAAAGQGMLPGSDVKIRGFNVGEVKRIELVDNRAQLTLRINDGVQVPTGSSAVVRPKTLFGEKFVDIDPGDTETTGPYLGDGGVLTQTLGGFELEQVLADLYPILQAIDPTELAVVIDELAKAGSGLGENINRSIVNGAALFRLQASNDAELRQFLGDLALLSETLDELAPDLVAGARDLNVALPTISNNGDRLSMALVNASRLADDLADLIENNKAFIDTSNTKGGDVIQILFDNRDQLQPVLLAVRRYIEVQVAIFRIEVGDGTLMAAVKGLTTAGGSPVPIGGASTAAGGPVLDPRELSLLTEVLGGGPEGIKSAQDLIDLFLGGER
jgi:phospholipid/cholesterol/gamma-HCH transport system substrate-binding protein